MRDRIPKYAGRVKLIPVSNQSNTYDMQRADEPLQEGTPLNRNTLLSDQTVEEFGLSLDATPDEAMRFLNARRKEFEQDINNTVDTFIKDATDILEDILEKDFGIAIGEFYYNGEEITLHFDFTPCVVFVQSGTTTPPIVSPLPTASVQTFMYDPDTMKDNSWTAKYLGEKQKICRYCAVGIDSVSFEPVVIPETSITVYRILNNGKPENTPMISETFVVSSPKIELHNYMESATDTGGNTYYNNVWEMSVNGGAYKFLIQSSSETYGSKLVLSPNINSDGSGPDDFVIQSSYPDTSYTTIELEEGKNYVLYAQLMS